MIGRGLFGPESEFWNPDLPINGDYNQLTAAFESLVRNLISYAHQRGMDCVLSTSVTEFPPEFAKVLNGAQKVHQLNSLVIGPGPNTSMDDPTLHEMSAAVLKSLVNTYPEMDALALTMPEHRQWVDGYESAWRELDARYGIGKIRSLPEVIEAARHRVGYDGTEDRVVREVKGDIVNLDFFDRLLRDDHVLKDTRRPDLKTIAIGVAEELLPVVDRILAPGSETLNQIDYTASRILKRPQVLSQIPGVKTPSVLIYTLHDDNVGLLPQLTTHSLARLTQLLKRYGWAGFSTRYWLIGDQDPAAAYLAKASWESEATPEAVNRDQLRNICGSACVEDMLEVLKEVEDATSNLEMNAPSVAFPVPDMMLKHWEAGGMPTSLMDARTSYRKALDLARQALNGSKASGKQYIDYWIGRLQFGIRYLDAVEQVHRAATAEAAHRRDETEAATTAALQCARESIAAYAGVAQDQSDRGAIAVLNEYVYRPLKAKLNDVRSRGN
jgi:hypothetical protein